MQYYCIVILTLSTVLKIASGNVICMSQLGLQEIATKKAETPIGAITKTLMTKLLNATTAYAETRKDCANFNQPFPGASEGLICIFTIDLQSKEKKVISLQYNGSPVKDTTNVTVSDSLEGFGFEPFNQTMVEITTYVQTYGYLTPGQAWQEGVAFIENQIFTEPQVVTMFQKRSFKSVGAVQYIFKGKLEDVILHPFLLVAVQLSQEVPEGVS